ncbi:MAG: glycosyltransferase [Clostridia bacterium]|nr:glycosyltransferase [Clostridia bacterium]
MRVIIMHETVTNHDAIGNDIELMYGILRERCDCKVFALNQFNRNVAYIDKDEMERIVDDPKLVVIYHHSVNWEYGFKLLRQIRGKIIIRYHNITPPFFFQAYNDWHYSQCAKGRDLTETMQRALPGAYWLCDSEYNASDLTETSPGRIGICPPFNKIEEWSRTRPDESVLKQLLESRTVNLLFVGRVAPNKGHLMMLDIVRTYCACYDANIKLRIIGKFDESIQKYNDLIASTIEAYGIQDNIEFVGEINDSTLMAYNLGSDVMLCCSEHEGFCVPIIEAQYFGLPIVALDSTAVPETMGPGQLCLDGDARLFAAAIRRVVENEEYKSFLWCAGRENYRTRFSYEKVRGIFLKEYEKGLRIR